ncbi:hypothetical protein LHYA1_G002094 [Lachnellula hyalina]|uniref:Zn(2)-C6 fungal-type domain-containing protein n=1 Tax=Lachnellula hyalina TaxID=1316788 RepID=A0A8H8R5B0_9HELO|nr:uncharacterized protein LHYA1_G002094 [Lachnellula hyalina]TVY28877.1 hypothetical protein LHYA1_G002094 [Lachnellula hyalina]
MDFFNPSSNNAGNFGYNPPIVHQGGGSRSQNGSGNSNSWQQSSSLISYTLASHNGANSPTQMFDGANAQSPQSGFFLQLSDSDLGSSWTGVTHANGDLEDIPTLDIPYESYDDSLGLSSPTTAGTSSSEGFVFPVIDSTLGTSPSANQLFDLDLSDEYFQIGQPLNPNLVVPESNSPLYDENFFFDNNGLQVSMDMTMYTPADAQWSASTVTQPKQHSASPIESSVLSNMPWNPQQVERSKYQADVNTGNGTFGPPRATPYDTYRSREEYLETGPSSQGSVGLEPVSPLGDSDSESWVITSTRSNYTPSHSSPRSHGSPQSHTSSPRHHSHVFSSMPGISKSKVTKGGRTRGLTTLEKKQAREVRDAKACWACHISKTKCSPCSPGSPCVQCARLVGKRRFCKFTCFNEPLESLYIFLVPVYLNGHLNRTDIEAFVDRNAESWGTRSMFVRMDWGYRKLLTAEVVALELRQNAPDMGFHHTTEESTSPDGKAKLVRRQSPPLGIPLTAMDDMQHEYSRYVQDIVQSDLKYYVPEAYFPDDSKLLTRLLGVVCDFYSVGLEADDECELLRSALEMHITTSIMERTLNLDPDSIGRVQNQLQQQYPEKTTAKCVQKQIKYAFYLGQQIRINKVLKDWGNMMWTIHNTVNNDKKWATSFCVFLILTLTIGKINGQMYYFCEGRIEHFGANPKSERAKCNQLMHLTEKELFDRCKEIFHWKFKTRKGGKEACNPIRDGVDSFRTKPVDSAIRNLTYGLQSVVREYAPQIRSHCSVKPEYQAGLLSPYMDLGRLACIFLDDFLDH